MVKTIHLALVVVWIEGISVISSLFFLTKNFHTHKKAENANKRLSPPQKILCAQKNAALGVFLFAYLRFVSWFLLVSKFLRLKVFCKKKKFEIVLIPSIHILPNNFETFCVLCRPVITKSLQSVNIVLLV